MKTIGLDLSTTCTGYSIFEDKKLIKFGQIKPKTTLTTTEKVEYIVREFVKIFKEIDVSKAKFIIEDIYLATFFGKNQVLGFANLGRISGAIMAGIFLELNKSAKDIILIKAISARPLVGLKGNCQKAEVQVWVLKKFLKKEIVSYQKSINTLINKKLNKQIKQPEFKKKMEEISKIIEKETGLSEDQADAILLGYCKS